MERDYVGSVTYLRTAGRKRGIVASLRAISRRLLLRVNATPYLIRSRLCASSAEAGLLFARACSSFSNFIITSRRS